MKKIKASLQRKCLKLEDAIATYKQIKCSEESNEKATLNCDIALIYRELKDFEKALKLYEEALPIFVKNNNSLALLRANNNMGVIYFSQKDYRNARKSFGNVIDLSLESDVKQWKLNYLSIGYFNLSDSFYREGNWKKAQIFAKKAIEKSKEYSLIDIELSAQLLLVRIGFALGELTEFDFIADTFLDNEKAQKNTILYQQLLSDLLFIAQFEKPSLLPLLCNQLINQIDTIIEDDYLIALFFGFYQQKKFWECTEIIEKIHSKENKKFLKAILKNQIEEITSFISRLLEDEDIWNLYFILSQVMICNLGINTSQIKELAQEAISIASFAPISQILQKKTTTTLNTNIVTLWEFVNCIHSENNNDEILKAVAIGILKISELDRVAFFEFDDEKFIAKFGFDNEKRLLNIEQLFISHTILNEMKLLEEEKYFLNLREEMSYDLQSSIFGLGLRTAVCFPIIINDEFIGVLYADAKSDKAFEIE